MTTSALVPSTYDVAFDGRPFNVDTQYLEQFTYQTLPPIRRQGDASAEAGESSLNPEGYWRRTSQTWHKGAGQKYYDKPSSDEERFRGSFHVDVWTEGEISLLHAMSETQALGAGYSEAYTAAGGIWVIKPFDVALHLTAPDATPSPSTGVITSAWSFATDGQTVWMTDGVSLYTVEVTATVWTKTLWISGDPQITRVWFAGGRLFCTGAGTGALYDISATGLSALPTALMGGTGESIRDITAVNGYIYIAADRASSDGQATIYKTTIDATGASLEAPSVAATLPEPSTAWLFGHLGFMLIRPNTTPGTTGGLRMAIPDSDGNLTVGSKFGSIEGGSNEPPGYISPSYRPVSIGRFVYVARAGGHGYDTVTGLARIDFSTINGSSPAWAMDLMPATGQTLWSVINWDGDPVGFSSDGDVWEKAATYETFGALEVGYTEFSMSDSKIAVAADAAVLEGSVRPHIRDAEGNVLGWGASATPTSPTTPLTSNQTSATYRVEFYLFPDGTSGEGRAGSFSLRVLPHPTPLEQVTVPVLLFDRQLNVTDTAVNADIYDDFDYLRGLRDTAALIDFQDGDRTLTAQVTGVDWVAQQRSESSRQWQGTALVTMKVVG